MIYVICWTLFSVIQDDSIFKNNWLHLKKKQMKVFKYLPNFITLLNLTMGIVAIYLSFIGGIEELGLASYFIFIAALFDFFDGFAARMLNAKSEIGLQLDSLADMVSFGVAPGFILYQMLAMSHGNPHEVLEGIDAFSLLAILIPWGAALRLAKFNIDDTQVNGFKGLPTPAMAFFIASLPLIRITLYEDRGMVYMIFTNAYFLGMVAILGFFLMTSSFPMFALKFKSFGWKDNEIKYVFLAISVVMLVAFKIVAVPFIIITYLFLSLVVYLINIQND
jgi:CDP-diacylglycerol--serine O-phosphatidyltransferase